MSIDSLLTVDLSKEKEDVIKNDFRVLTTVVDSDNDERICIVPTKASAGYLNGLADPEYVAELSHFAMPVAELSQERSYRVFQISGDSMLPIPPGAYIFCSYVESLDGVHNGKPYIVITANDGIVYKRVFNYADEDGTLLLKSDNIAYNPYRLDLSEVLEIWQSIGFLTFELPEPERMDIGQLSTMVLEMQEELKQLRNSQ